MCHHPDIIHYENVMYRNDWTHHNCKTNPFQETIQSRVPPIAGESLLRQLKLLYIAWPLPASLNEQSAELTVSSLFVRKMLNDTACNRAIDFIF